MTPIQLPNREAMRVVTSVYTAPAVGAGVRLISVDHLL